MVFRRFLIVFASMALLGIGAGQTAADQLLPLPDFDHEFIDPIRTRGYWFTAPTSFIITGLRVPTDVGTDPQNIEVLRLNDTPPDFPDSTSDFESLAFFNGVDSLDFIDTSITVFAGDVIGVLGARGTSVMQNSYSAVNEYTSSILGVDVELKRLLFQENLFEGPASAVSTEDANPIARVQMRLTAIPEPSTLIACLSGAACLGIVAVTRKHRTRAL